MIRKSLGTDENTVLDARMLAMRILALKVDVQVERELDHAAVVLSGPFDLAHSTEVVRAVESAEAQLDGCHSAEVRLTQVNRIDGRGTAADQDQCDSEPSRAGMNI